MFSSCGLSLTPSFARRVAFSELLRQLFSLRLRLQPEIAIPDWAVSQCDGGHGAAAGCAQLLRPSVAERLHVGRSVAELPPSKLSNFGHSVNFMDGFLYERRIGGWSPSPQEWPTSER